jgi:hypothetical protein
MGFHEEEMGVNVGGGELKIGDWRMAEKGRVGYFNLF